MNYFNFNHSLPLVWQQSGFVADSQKSTQKKETDLVEKNLKQIETVLSDDLQTAGKVENDLNSDSAGNSYYTSFFLNLKKQQKEIAQTVQNVDQEYVNHFANYLKILIKTYNISQKLKSSFGQANVHRGLFLNNII